ncbi:LLM class flavin-dependent oxidoreductase [Leptospira levettii]|uniref:LLM class flavin-dependent oxidoreductase n=1 Tax=Leptospira levettii TaxID=2023178 RepID=A0AAW5V696_9LEPT|nr:LLM class flavin-dependent oxidoreductase [Leptospira levettii]MCW7465996.1 LLM class flavin-dependent oxidoreductase [Leptospira levettii]MCW7510734.1 LLM class flavin-dependent oxidoreductase [Leptospira levettii]MCW7514487.1 LLM class flavin-dependent oxidoreductase [Leptospira levettii]TGL05084.1 LLM class flavin-dependent oxidoreductase [Leptospira levettii]
MNPIPNAPAIRSEDTSVEVAWFCDLCNGDYEFLGVPDGSLRSSFEHCADIIRIADELGYQNILLPSSYQTGQDTLTFAAAASQFTKHISLLTAIRCGEIHPPMLARTLSTLDHMLKGRLNINIISSDLPGTLRDSKTRYEISKEVIQILQQGWTRDHINFQGKHYQLDLTADPVKSYQTNGGPLLYFGGISEDARALCAEFCDVFLMWPETEERLADTMKDLSERAFSFGRKIDFGLRIHLIVRDTEKEAKDAAKRLLSKLNIERANDIKHRALDSNSAGVLRQDELRKSADSDLFIEPMIWSGIGLARSGCGSAIVGTPEQVYEKIQRYIQMGIRAFIFSGYPLIEESKLFAEKVLPKLKTVNFAEAQGRKPKGIPVTPLTTGERK